MNKAIVSFAIGDLHTSLLEVATPTFYRYANRHHYDLIIPSYSLINNICLQFGWDVNRPASWLKVPIIKFLFDNGYDIVLWLDSDIIINKFDIDIAEDFAKSDCTQGFVIHNDKYEGKVPNCGVWILKKDSVNLLNDIWNNISFIDHKWWEQAANIDIIEKNNMSKMCYSLDYKFNVHMNDIRYDDDSEKNGIMLHATMRSDRLKTMKDWAATI
jgi:hypothetical protein